MIQLADGHFNEKEGSGAAAVGELGCIGFVHLAVAFSRDQGTEPSRTADGVVST